MLTLISFFRTLLIITTCVVLSSCTQTSSGTSSYGGKLGSKSSVEKARQTKILASRKRARTIQQAERKKFLKKRFGKRYAKSRTTSSNSRARKSRYNKKRSYKKKGTRVSSRSASRKHSKRRGSTKRRSKSRTKRIKKSSYAYVGGRSKGIRRNSKPWRCVPGRLKKVLRQISKKYGRVTINSTHRSKRHNRRVGGKRRSYHLRCQAVDFRVHGRTRGLTRWLANHPLVGGYNRYPSGYYHIDTGPKRTW